MCNKTGWTRFEYMTVPEGLEFFPLNENSLLIPHEKPLQQSVKVNLSFTTDEKHLLQLKNDVLT